MAGARGGDPQQTSPGWNPRGQPITHGASGLSVLTLRGQHAAGPQTHRASCKQQVRRGQATARPGEAAEEAPGPLRHRPSAGLSEGAGEGRATLFFRHQVPRAPEALGSPQAGSS